jgi:hypothetical protein
MTSLDFAALARTILEQTCQHPVRLIAVDGGAGAGKSTFAAALATALGDVPVVPLDDFSAWDDLTEYWPRFEAEVLGPLFQRRALRYQQRDWTNDWAGRSLGPFREVPFSETWLFEGIGSARRELASRLSYAIWIETPATLRLERGVERDGEGARALWERFMPGEQAFFEADGTRERADLVVDGTRRFEADVARFAVLRAGRSG